MSNRSRIRSTFVQAGGGGGAPPTTANLEWGPDFGESSDNNTFTVGVDLTMPALALENNKSVGVQLTMPSLAMESTKSVGVHLSGTALGAPLWQAVATANGTTDTETDIVCNKPGTPQVGDLLLAFAGAEGPGLTISPPAGWTLVRNEISGNFKSGVWYRIADGTEGATFTFTYNVNAGRTTLEIHLIRAVDQSTPINASGGSSASVTDPVVTSVTTTNINCLVFYFVYHDHLATSATHTAPASNTERTDFEGTELVGTALCGSTSGTRIFAATGATGTATVNCTEVVATTAVYHRIAIAPGAITLAS